jgi:L-fuconolactonase
MKIDAHQHFWKYDSENYAWIDQSMSKIKRDFLPNDLKTILEKNQIDGCVLVQVNQTEEETIYFNGLAEQHEFIKGVVGWTDLLSSNLNSSLENYSKLPKIKGFRHIVQVEPVGFMQNPSFISGVQLLAKYNFTYDILI